ncbi:MAG: hypothetical protein AAF320_02315 [Myxococcota bacterium]
MIGWLSRFASSVSLWFEDQLRSDPYEKLDHFVEDMEEQLVTARVILHFVAEQTFLTDDRAQQSHSRFVVSGGKEMGFQNEFKAEESLFFRQLCQIVILEGEIRSQVEFLEKFKEQRRLLRRLYLLEQKLLRKGCTKSQLEKLLPEHSEKCFEKIVKMAVQCEQKTEALQRLFLQSEHIAYAAYPDKPSSILPKARRRARF